MFPGNDGNEFKNALTEKHAYDAVCVWPYFGEVAVDGYRARVVGHQQAADETGRRLFQEHFACTRPQAKPAVRRVFQADDGFADSCQARAVRDLRVRAKYRDNWTAACRVPRVA